MVVSLIVNIPEAVFNDKIAPNSTQIHRFGIFTASLLR